MAAILTASIRVANKPGGGIASFNGSLKSIYHQLFGHTLTDAPTNYHPAVQVKHDR
jgi:hypothetical protein